MARIRTIKPEFPQSESMGRVCREARLLFIMLWTICDDHGRGRGNSRMLASLLFPYDEDAPTLVDGWMAELEEEGCVVRYIGPDGAAYFASVNWEKHQRIDKPGKSKCPPPPPGKIREASENVRESSRQSRERSCLDQGSRKGSEDQGPRSSEGKPSDAFASKAPSPDDRTWVFNEGLSWLETSTGKPAPKLRPQVGRWLKDLHDDPAKLRRAIEEAAKLNPADPIAWLTKAVQTRSSNGNGASGNDEDEHMRIMVRGYKATGIWPITAGAKPDQPHNNIPKTILAEFGFRTEWGPTKAS